MIFKLKIDMGTKGAKDADDIAAILAEAAGRVAQKVGEDGEFGLLRNDEGARIGRWEFSDHDVSEFVVGEKDTTGASYGCGESFYDSDGDAEYACSRPAHGSSEPHAAGNGSEIVAVWHAV